MRASSRQRGTALITAAVIIMVTALFATLLLNLPKAAHDGQKTTEDKEAAYYCANTGVSDAVSRLDGEQGMPSTAVNGVWTLSIANPGWTQTNPRPFGSTKTIGAPGNYAGYWFRMTALNAPQVILIESWGYAPSGVGFTGAATSAKRITAKVEAVVKYSVVPGQVTLADMGAVNFVGQDWSNGNTPHQQVLINGTGSTYNAISGNRSLTLPAGFTNTTEVNMNPGVTFGGDFGNGNHNEVIVMNSSAAASSVTGVNGNGTTHYTHDNFITWNGNSTIPANVTDANSSSFLVSDNTNTSTAQIFGQLEGLGTGGTGQVVITNPGSSINLNGNVQIGTSSAASPKLVHVVLSGSSVPSPLFALQGSGDFYGIVYIDARNYTGAMPAEGFLKNNTANNMYGLFMVDGPTATFDMFANNSKGLIAGTNTGNITGTVAFKSNGLQTPRSSGSGNFGMNWNGQGSANAMPFATLTGGNGKPAIQFSNTVVSDTLTRLNLNLNNRIKYTVQSYRVLPTAR